MFSVEDPYLPLSPDRGVGVQIMGPQDTYMCQFDRDTSKFAGDPRALALSHVFEYYGAKQNDERPAVPDEKFFTSKATAEFFEKVKRCGNCGIKFLRSFGPQRFMLPLFCCFPNVTKINRTFLLL